MNKMSAGFSLVELLIAMVLGATLFGGLVGFLIASDETTTDSVQRSEMQENGRLALDLISRDVMLAGYYGRFTGKNIHDGLSSGAVSLSNVTLPVGAAECTGEGGNNVSFPSLDANAGQFFFRHIWGLNATSSSALTCITSALIGSDIIQIKRAIGQVELNNTIEESRFYLSSNNTQATFFSGADAPPANTNDAIINEYQHIVYYVQLSENIPTLYMENLVNQASNGVRTGQMKSQPLIQGIERLGFLYGVDTDLDGIANFYDSAENIQDEYWDHQDSAIISVKIHVLVRALDPDANVDNNNAYDMGSFTYTANDNYKRMLLTNTVRILNAERTAWRN